MTDERWKPETRTAQGLGWTCPLTGAVVPPIHLSTTYVRDTDYAKRDGRGYIRDDNPSFDLVERMIADLEGAEDAAVFASGMAAATALFMALAPGDRVVVPDQVYYGVPKWLDSFGRHWGLVVDRVPAGDMAALGRTLAAAPARLVWVETPANPTWTVTDIAAAATAAHAAGAQLVVDSTAATPVFTRPLELGADIVLHSATKYLNGHSDVIAGALATAQRDALWARVREHREHAGPLLGSVEAYLLQRGLRTLFVRVRRQAATAAHLAQRLHGHPKVARVLYPGLADHPNHEVAARQMAGGFGGMMSLRIAGGAAAALRVATACRLFQCATSLGGVESLIEHRATIEGEGTATPPDLLRLSVGLEAPDDLLADLENALATA